MASPVIWSRRARPGIVAVKVKEAIAPKAIFPFYLPGGVDSFLGVYPLSHDTIRFPQGADNLQIEPEVALLCDIGYQENKVVSLTPPPLPPITTVPSRKEGPTISEKKNWGPQSKGVSATLLPLDLAAGGVLDDYRIASFLRVMAVHYGVDSPAVEYSYFRRSCLTGSWRR